MTKPGTGLTLLVVDDDLDLLPILVLQLTDLTDFRVLTATDGMQALALFETEHLDCAIIDVKMPGINGLQVVRALRGDPQTADMPIVILSAMNQNKDQYAGLLSGVDQYLLKPVVGQELVQAIMQATALSADERRQRLLRLADEPETEYNAP